MLITDNPFAMHNLIDNIISPLLPDLPFYWFVHAVFLLCPICIELLDMNDLKVEYGRMNQHAIAFEGINYIDTNSNAKIECLNINYLLIVVANS